MDYLVITECVDFLKFKEKIKIFFMNYWQIYIVYKIRLANYQCKGLSCRSVFKSVFGTLHISIGVYICKVIMRVFAKFQKLT